MLSFTFGYLCDFSKINEQIFMDFCILVRLDKRMNDSVKKDPDDNLDIKRSQVNIFFYDYEIIYMDRAWLNK